MGHLDQHEDLFARTADRPVSKDRDTISDQFSHRPDISRIDWEYHPQPVVLTRRPNPTVYLCLSIAALTACTSIKATSIKATGARPIASVDPNGIANAAAFFRQPVLSSPRLSPDGKHMVGVMSRGGRESIVLLPLEVDGPPRNLMRNERDEDFGSWTVSHLGWGSNKHVLVSIEMPNVWSRRTARQSRLIVYNLDEGRPRYLGRKWRRQAYTQFQDQIISPLPADPEGVLLSLWMPGQPGTGARRVDLITGKLRTVVQPRRGTLGWAADFSGAVRIGWGQERSSAERFMLARIREKDRFEEILRWNPHEQEGFSFAGFSKDPDAIYVYSASEAGRLALYPYNLRTRTKGKELFAHPKVDIGGLTMSKVDGRLVAVSYVDEKPELHFFDPEFARLQAQIDRVLPGRLNRIVSSDRAEKLFVIRSSADHIPPAYLLLTREGLTMDLLFEAYPELSRAKLARMESFTCTARDGLEIPGYITRPPHKKGPHPLIVMPHGGPWARDVWGWDPIVQFLASRGFAVLQPNFRGSEGYGFAFMERGRGRWGLEMQDDITDATLCAVDRGIVDRERIGIFGISYGGYAALRAVQKEPDLFRAAASFAGVTDLLKLLDDESQYYGALANMEALIGDRSEDREHLIAVSPARGAGQIRAPVLIAHGTEDPTVQITQATYMAEALEEAGAEVETYIYEDEVHGFIDERNEIDFFTRLAAFFGRNLTNTATAAAVP